MLEFLSVRAFLDSEQQPYSCQAGTILQRQMSSITQLSRYLTLATTTLQEIASVLFMLLASLCAFAAADGTCVLHPAGRVSPSALQQLTGADTVS